MASTPLFQKVDAVSVPVPDIDNVVVLLDLSKGRYITDNAGTVRGIEQHR